MSEATKGNEPEVLHIGSRLELFTDRLIIDRLEGNADLRLHEPVPREIALRTDAPWEGCRGGYMTVLRDDDRYRMYYKANHSWNSRDENGAWRENATLLRIAYAESLDGLDWFKPNLGIYEIFGTNRNNIVWDGVGELRTGVHGFAPFKDANPDVPETRRYKAFGTKIGKGADEGIYLMTSADAVHWSLEDTPPVITKGKFDSQNTAFWDAHRGVYRAYLRNFHPVDPGPYRADHLNMGMRDIRTCVSKDFLVWDDPEPLRYSGAPEEAFYTNQIAPYYRAPHILLGFPARYVERPWSETVEALPDLADRRERSAISTRYGTVTTDTVLISSRDGVEFHKWPDVFLRPGPYGAGGWTYGDAFLGNGPIETPVPDDPSRRELSFFGTQNYWRGDHTIFRRYSLRIDGFVSVRANLLGGELVTRPVTFDGDELEINYSTSAAGRILVEMQEPDGTPISGYELESCVEIVGDEIARRVVWSGGRRPGSLSRKPVRLRFVILDGDIFSMRFTK